jgi:diguanylate cyclase (GGDEF)-like protein
MNTKSYKILIVDDDAVIHQITELLLLEMNFIDFNLEVLTAYSAKEARVLLDSNKDIALALIDINMETSSAGLELIDYIRNELKYNLIRLVLRTSEIDKYPAINIIQEYDINDYIDKASVGKSRLFTTIRSSLNQYIQLLELDNKFQETYKRLTTNHVTSLPNRIKFYEDSVEEKNKTLILIDIVSFSVINETNGRDSGDFVLKELGAFLQTMYGDDFYVYHFDNDLFALITRDSFSENIFKIVEKIKDDISKLNIVTNNFNETISTTIGVASHSENNLIKKAEFALKEARIKGKNQIKYYSEDLQIIQRFNDVKEWSPKLKSGELKAYYQPIYDLKTNEIDKYELLVRLKHEGEVHTPFKFLAAAQESGQIYDIFKFMFKEACIKAKQTSKRFSVNIGDNEFTNDGIVKYIKDTLSTCGSDPKLLSLEILEYKSIDHSGDVIKIINEIHNLGIEIVVDDFGVECSNFGQIECLPIDVIKIDGSFIKNLPTSADSQIIVNTIKTFALAKNIKLVAEFVCDKEVYDMVKKYDIDFAQGYYLGKPSSSIESIERDL